MERLKPVLAFEVRKSSCMKFEDAVKVPMRVESDYKETSEYQQHTPQRSPGEPQSSSKLTLMETGNLKSHKQKLSNNEKQQLRRSNKYLKCQKVNCSHGKWIAQEGSIKTL